MTDDFESAAVAMAEALGASDQAFITIPHPISSASDTELDRIAREAAGRCMELLTRS